LSPQLRGIHPAVIISGLVTQRNHPLRVVPGHMITAATSPPPFRQLVMVTVR